MADRISSLPDSLLLQILSSLQIKQAIATSRLSKRWRFLWHCLPNLEFDDLHFRYEFLLQSVDATLLFVDLKPVQKFVLKCEFYSLPPLKVSIWLNALLSRSSITYLEVLLRQRDAFYPLPPRLFTCNAISVLKLSGFSCNVSRVDLPSLKVLHLLDMQFSNRKCLNLILSNCLHLEELVLKSLFNFYHSSSIKPRRLEHLLFADIPEYLISWEALTNVQFLHFKECSRHTVHKAPTFHNVIHLELNKFYCQDGCMTMSYLQCFPKLQCLVIHQQFKRCDDEEGMEHAPDVPPCVSYHLKEFVVLEFNGSKKEFEFVRLIMENATHLRTVIVGSAYKWGAFEMFKRISSYLICSAKCRLFFDVSEESIKEAMRKCLTIRKLYAIPSYEN